MKHQSILGSLKNQGHFKARTLERDVLQIVLIVQAVAIVLILFLLRIVLELEIRKREQGSQPRGFRERRKREKHTLKFARH